MPLSGGLDGEYEIVNRRNYAGYRKNSRYTIN